MKVSLNVVNGVSFLSPSNVMGRIFDDQAFVFFKGTCNRQRAGDDNQLPVSFTYRIF